MIKYTDNIGRLITAEVLNRINDIEDKIDQSESNIISSVEDVETTIRIWSR